MKNFIKPHLSLYNYHTRNSRFNLPSVRLDVETNFAIFQNIKCFTVAAAQLVCQCLTMLLKLITKGLY